MTRLLLVALVASACSTTQPQVRIEDGGGRRYIVRKGDNLYQLARRWGVTVEEIAALNAIEDPKSLQVGQVIIVPKTAGPDAVADGAPAEGVPPSDEDEVSLADPLQRPPPVSVGGCEAAAPSIDRTSDRPWIWPVDGVVVSRYGRRDGDQHEGIDIAAPTGTPIWAAADGRVLFAGERSGYGRIVIIRHDAERVTIYAHNARNCVGEGSAVRKGDVVGLVGNSGGSASPAVHFETRMGENTVNPRRWLP